jgi:nucleoside-diphosphate-sugar epimerase
MQMLRLLVTGASGYIGRRFCEVAAERGCEVIVLGPAPSTGKFSHAFAWRLGDEPRPEAFAGIAAVIHLAHSWASDAQNGASSANVNLSGSERLARVAFANNVPRFVFASTTSARSQALNAYGRVKYALEERLLAVPHAAGRMICARIGLVYGGPEEGLYGQLSKLVRFTPILPMTGLDRKVQPIYIDEVVAALLSLAIDPLPRRDGVSAATYVLAGPETITFGNWLRMLRRAHTGKRILLLPIPLWMALFACDLARLLPFISTVNRERVLGLASTEPMDAALDLAALHIDIDPPMKRLNLLRSDRRRIIVEAIAMLAYVSGKQAPPRAAVARLVRGIERQDAQPLGLPRVVTKCPALLRAFEPLWPSVDHRLTQRLHLAVMVVESMREQFGGRSNIGSLFGQAALEAMAVPFRLLLGQRYT